MTNSNKKGFISLAGIIIGAVIIVGTFFGIYTEKEFTKKNEEISQLQTKVETKLGADSNLFLGGFPYYLAGSGITSSASSFTLTTFTLPQNSYPIQDSDLSTTFYITFEPGSKTRQEFASCTTVGANTGGNVTISGCTRGLSAITPYTASTTQRFSHSGGSSVIFSNSPAFYDTITFKGNDESITGSWSFPTPTIGANPATMSYAQGLAFNGVATSTENTFGGVKLATKLQQASSTATTANDAYVIQAQNATSTYNAGAAGGNGLNVLITDNGNKIDGNFIDMTENYTWSGNTTLSGATTTMTSATTTISGKLGIGTTSPYTSLGVAGEVVANNFTATSTTATTTLTNVNITGTVSGTVPTLMSQSALNLYVWSGSAEKCSATTTPPTGTKEVITDLYASGPTVGQFSQVISRIGMGTSTVSENFASQQRYLATKLTATSFTYCVYASDGLTSVSLNAYWFK